LKLNNASNDGKLNLYSGYIFSSNPENTDTRENGNSRCFQR